LDGRRGGIDGDEGDYAFGATCKHDRQRDFAAAGGVEDGVDPPRCDRADAVEKPVAIGHRLGADRAQIVEVAFACRGDHSRSGRDGLLKRECAHATGGGMDQQLVGGVHAELIELGVGDAAPQATLPAISQLMAAGFLISLTGSASARSVSDVVSQVPMTASPTRNSVISAPT
jgi:hypothetical protein